MNDVVAFRPYDKLHYIRKKVNRTASIMDAVVRYLEDQIGRFSVDIEFYISDQLCTLEEDANKIKSCESVIFQLETIDHKSARNEIEQVRCGIELTLKYINDCDAEATIELMAFYHHCILYLEDEHNN